MNAMYVPTCPYYYEKGGVRYHYCAMQKHESCLDNSLNKLFKYIQLLGIDFASQANLCFCFSELFCVLVFLILFLI